MKQWNRQRNYIRFVVVISTENLDIKYGDTWISLKNDYGWMNCDRAGWTPSKCYLRMEALENNGKFYIHDSSGNTPDSTLTHNAAVTLNVVNRWVTCPRYSCRLSLPRGRGVFVMKKLSGTGTIRAGDKVFFEIHNSNYAIASYDTSSTSDVIKMDEYFVRNSGYNTYAVNALWTIHSGKFTFNISRLNFPNVIKRHMQRIHSRLSSFA